MSTTNDPLIFEISQNNFSDLVIHNSSHLLVVAEFMGVWSEPCIKTADALSGLAVEFPGEFIFAKIDIDEQPELREEYSIVNVPTIVVFKDGKEIQREEGELREEELRVLLKHYGVFKESDEMRDKAREAHLSGDTQSAIMLLTKAIQSDPSNVRVALDMVQIFLDIGEVDQAQSLFDRLPESAQKLDMGSAIATQLKFTQLASKTIGKEKLQEKVSADKQDYQSRFDLALCFFAEHNVEQAMELLFFIQEHKPNFKDGAARELIGTACNMLTNSNPEKSTFYRQRLSNLINQ